MAEILHQLIDSLSHYLQGFIHPRWCKISAINSITCLLENRRSNDSQNDLQQKHKLRSEKKQNPMPLSICLLGG